MRLRFQLRVLSCLDALDLRLHIFVRWVHCFAPLGLATTASDCFVAYGFSQ